MQAGTRTCAVQGRGRIKRPAGPGPQLRLQHAAKRHWKRRQPRCGGRARHAAAGGRSEHGDRQQGGGAGQATQQEEDMRDGQQAHTQHRSS